MVSRISRTGTAIPVAVEDGQPLPVTGAFCPGPPACTQHLRSDFADFDHYVETNGIPPARHGEAFAVWLSLSFGRPMGWQPHRTE